MDCHLFGQILKTLKILWSTEDWGKTPLRPVKGIDHMDQWPSQWAQASDWLNWLHSWIAIHCYHKGTKCPIKKHTVAEHFLVADSVWMVCCQWFAIWIAPFIDPQLQGGRFSFSSSPPDQKERSELCWLPKPASGIVFIGGMPGRGAANLPMLVCISSWAPYFCFWLILFIMWFAGHKLCHYVMAMVNQKYGFFPKPSEYKEAAKPAPMVCKSVFPQISPCPKSVEVDGGRQCERREKANQTAKCVLTLPWPDVLICFVEIICDIGIRAVSLKHQSLKSRDVVHFRLI